MEEGTTQLYFDFSRVRNMLRAMLGELHTAKSRLGYISSGLRLSVIAEREPTDTNMQVAVDGSTLINDYYMELTPAARFDSRYCGTARDPDIRDLFLNVARSLARVSPGNEAGRRVATVPNDQLSSAVEFLDLYAWITGTDGHGLALLTETGELLDADAAHALRPPTEPQTPVFPRDAHDEDRDGAQEAVIDRCPPMSSEQDIPLILRHPFFNELRLL